MRGLSLPRHRVYGMVLELANLQLEEYHMMDQRLDRSLNLAYDDLRRRRFGFWGTYSAALRTLLLFRVDLSKLNNEVTHISKLFGDWYLAGVYLGACERFHLNQWRSSVEERLEHLDHLYSAVNTDINTRRMVWLETLIVIFFAIDLLAFSSGRNESALWPLRRSSGREVPLQPKV